MYPKLECGDIIITDNQRTGTKIVKFLSTCRTCWHHLFYFLFDKDRLESLRPAGYHYSMALNENKIIEQQSKVEINSVNKIYKRTVYIYRKVGLTAGEKRILEKVSKYDIGKAFGIVECIGKLLSWLTGIQILAYWFDYRGTSICVVRVGEWLSYIGDNLGVRYPNYLTARLKEDYLDRPNKWKLIYKKEM